tara:strand:- start:4 stop:582 length:579 start_codon:yes stop_codon:yes gene_type:complete
MFYAICDGPPWFFLKFETLEAMKTCDAIDEYSIVYSTPEQLCNSCTKEELEALVFVVKPDSEKTFTKERATATLHEIVVKQASFWKPENGVNFMPTYTDEAPVPEMDSVLGISITKPRQVRTRFNNNDKIVCLLSAPNIRKGTNRHRNMIVVMDSASVGEAIQRLSALTPSPGSGMDIRIALKAGAIELEEV